VKLDIKNIIILVLIVISSFSIWRWITKTDDKSQERIDQLEKDFKGLERQKDSLDNNIKLLKAKSNELEKKDSCLQEENKRMEILVKSAESETNKYKQRLDKSIKEQLETKKKIKELEKNPIKREGNYLLESIKNKTK
jgi:chromosome segregation ATPase